MKILVTGKGGRSGSWKVRGEQLGSAMGAAVIPLAADAAVEASDVAVVVKRATDDLVRRLRVAGKPWVYDIVDAYPQPECARWTRAETIEWARRHIGELNPTAVIWPTQRMRDDLDDGRPGIVLHHHARPGQALNPVREEVRTVAYEGRAAYLGEWAAYIDKACAARGWRFVVNPPSLADVDIVVAFRGSEWNCYATKAWKSNVKLANAHATGTPFIGQPDSGYTETATGAEYWAPTPANLGPCFDWLASQSAREQVRDRFLSAAITVEVQAGKIRQFLGSLC